MVFFFFFFFGKERYLAHSRVHIEIENYVHLVLGDLKRGGALGGCWACGGYA